MINPTKVSAKENKMKQYPSLKAYTQNQCQNYVRLLVSIEDQYCNIWVNAINFMLKRTIKAQDFRLPAKMSN